jgi:hypothetical protein
VSNVKHFKVVVGSLSVRAAPNVAAERTGSLFQGMTIAVDPNSQRSADGFIWWRHPLGWSAEKQIGSSDVFLEPVAESLSIDTGGSDRIPFLVVSGPLSVRAAPGLSETYVGSLPAGVQVQVTPGTETHADGFVWWQHHTGWSAEKTADNSRVFMERAQTNPPPEPPPAVGGTRTFRVLIGPLAVLAAPGLNQRRLTTMRYGTEVVADARSRTEVDGHVWWKHAGGWSAERTVNNSRVFMELIAETPGEPEPPPPPREPEPPKPPPQEPPTAPPGLTFRVLINLSIRSEPRISAERVGQFYQGDYVTVDPSSLVQADGYIWWRHSRGWSAERNMSDGQRYMEVAEGGAPPADPDNLILIPLPDGGIIRTLPIFTRLSVDIAATQWIQYFGNTVFAYRLRLEGRFWYNYSQGLHGGFDFGVSRPNVPVYAGLEGEVISLHRGTTVYSPNYIQVKSGPFTVLYGHVTNLRNLTRGQAVRPDTILCDAEYPVQSHLHLEVRYDGRWIINPLALMQNQLRTPMMQRYSDFASYFYRDAVWRQWLTPLDQPVLRLGGPIIGPHGRR